MRAITIILAGFLAIATAANDKKVVCYFGSWTGYRPGNGKFDPSNIDPSLCSHLIYSFVGLAENGTVNVLDPWNDLPEGRNGFAKFNAVRIANPSILTMAAVGGWIADSVRYSNLSADANLRKKFVENVVTFLKKYDFDGCDITWKYPNQRGGQAADKQNFVLLLKELRERFDKEGLILSIAVAAVESSASLSYDISAVSQHPHFINLMAYNLHGAFDKKTGINAPTYSSDELSDQAIIKYWLQQGAPASKLVLGVPFYGHGCTLADPKKNGLGAPISGLSLAGPYTKEAGVLSYLEICEKFQNETNWQIVYVEEQQVPYAFRGDQWVGYDNERSLTEKCRLAMKHELGGVGVWSIENDDFRGNCGGGKFPLLKAINKAVLSSPTEASSEQEFVGVSASGPPSTTTKKPLALK